MGQGRGARRLRGCPVHPGFVGGNAGGKDALTCPRSMWWRLRRHNPTLRLPFTGIKKVIGPPIFLIPSLFLTFAF